MHQDVQLHWVQAVWWWVMDSYCTRTCAKQRWHGFARGGAALVLQEHFSLCCCIHAGDAVRQVMVSMQGCAMLQQHSHYSICTAAATDAA